MENNKICRNKCQFMGRLVADAKTEVLANGKTLTSFSIAVKNDYKSGDNWIHETLFLDCSAFDEKTEKLLGYLKKGREIVVYGRLKMTEYHSTKYQHKIKKPFLLVGAVDVLLDKTTAENMEKINNVFS